MVARFYTLPPLELSYPYILVNANKPEPGLRYLAKHRRVVEAVIIDSGVEIFREKGVRDYPGGYRGWIERRLLPLYKRVNSIVNGWRTGLEVEVYVTIPDYPDDYNPGSLWESEQRTNIERTLDSIDYAINNYATIPWLIPVQGHYEEPESILESLEELEAIGALHWARRNTKYLAIANLCVSKKCNTIEKTVSLARLWLNQHGYTDLKLHVFGPAVNCVKQIARYIYSWDSTAWTRPRAPNGSSAWNGEERAYLFLTWIKKYADLIDMPDLPRSMRRRLALAQAQAA